MLVLVLVVLLYFGRPELWHPHRHVDGVEEGQAVVPKGRLIMIMIMIIIIIIIIILT